jgi:predicted DNA-binding transcriptional regulator AlpA
MRRSQLARALGVSGKSIDNLVARGTIPRPFRLGPKTIIFSTAEVREALARLAEKSAGGGPC